MKLNEEKQLKKITDELTEAVVSFTQREYKAARDKFDVIIEEYKDSEYYSVLEIQTRSKVYKNICLAKLNPIKDELNSDEDYLYQGIFSLNAGDLDKALELFNHLKESSYDDPYLDYLITIAYLKNEQIPECIDSLKECIAKDDYYKIIAHNEPDFSTLFDNDEFLTLIDGGSQSNQDVE
jgi:tetratricopeptide (TPR) repeat protein